MGTLLININGENIQSTENITVVGKPEDAIINKFYFELVKGIVKGVTVPGIGEVKKRSLVTDFEANNKEAFARITEQWELVKQVLLGENPTGTRTITLPEDYIDWLKFHSNPVYNEIAKNLASRGNVVEISIEKIYTNAIDLLVSNIELSKQYEQFLVNDNYVDDDSAISLDIRKRIGMGIPFMPFESVGENGLDEEDSQDEVAVFSSRVKHRVFPEEFGLKIDNCNYYHRATRSNLPLWGDGLIVVKNESNQRYGYVDEKGLEVIPCDYCEAMPFSAGYAWVQKEMPEGEWLIINAKGEMVNVINEGCGIKYCNGSQLELENGSIYYQNGEYIGKSSRSPKEGYDIDDSGVHYWRNGHGKLYENTTPLTDTTNDLIIKEYEGKYGVVNKISGAVYVPFEYSNILYFGKYFYYLEKDDDNKFLAHINI